jgi:hypothetical protein
MKRASFFDKSCRHSAHPAVFLHLEATRTYADGGGRSRHPFPLAQVHDLLQGQGRVSYRALPWDDGTLQHALARLVEAELLYQRQVNVIPPKPEDLP